MENHGLGTWDTKWRNIGWKFNWKYPTIYSAHLSKSANYLGYFWKKFSSHVHCPCCTNSNAISLQMVKLSTKRWHLAKRPLKRFFYSLFLQKKGENFKLTTVNSKHASYWILDIMGRDGRKLLYMAWKCM